VALLLSPTPKEKERHWLEAELESVGSGRVGDTVWPAMSGRDSSIGARASGATEEAPRQRKAAKEELLSAFATLDIQPRTIATRWSKFGQICTNLLKDLHEFAQICTYFEPNSSSFST